MWWLLAVPAMAFVVDVFTDAERDKQERARARARAAANERERTLRNQLRRDIERRLAAIDTVLANPATPWDVRAQLAALRLDLASRLQ